MNLRLSPLVGLLVVLLAAEGRSQVIHLPTFEQFSVSTTVVVPDSGRGFLGGVKRARYGSSSRGFPLVSKVPGLSRLAKNRAIGSSLSSSGASVTATIIDHAEYDREVLGEAAARRGVPLVLSATDRKAAYLSAHVARPEDDSALSLAPTKPNPNSRDIRARVASAERQRAAQLESYFARARRAEEAGRLGAARCCYNVLVRRGNELQQLQAKARLAALDAREKAIALAAREARAKPGGSLK
jgi:hypothetical protein